MAGKTGGSLTDEEKHIVEALLNRGMTGQDILNLLNIMLYIYILCSLVKSIDVFLTLILTSHV